MGLSWKATAKPGTEHEVKLERAWQEVLGLRWVAKWLTAHCGQDKED